MNQEFTVLCFLKFFVYHLDFSYYVFIFNISIDFQNSENVHFEALIEEKLARTKRSI